MGYDWYADVLRRTFRKARGVAFSFRAEFCENEAAPMASPYTPLVGSDLVIVDEEGDKASVSGGAMQFLPQTTPAWGDLGFYTQDSYVRNEGRAVFFNVNYSTLAEAYHGWQNAQSLALTSYDDLGVKVNGTALEVDFVAANLNIYTLAPSTDYIICVILRTNGRYIYLFDGTDWLLLWLDDVDNTVNVFNGLSNFDSNLALDSNRISQLAPALFIPPVQIIGAVAAHASNVADADQFGEATLASLNSSIYIRKQDATNYWAITVNGIGAILLVEVVGGTGFGRIADVAGLVGTETIRWSARGNVIEIWYDSTSAGSYASANNFLRETGYEIPSAGDFTDLSIYKSYTRSVIGLGAELVTNGGFDTDTDWTKGTGWTIAAGVATIGNAFTFLEQASLPAIGTLVTVTFDVTLSAGGIRLFIGTGNQQIDITITGTYSITGFVLGSQDLKFQSVNGIGTMDNVSVKEVQFVPDALGERLNQASVEYDCGSGFSSGFSSGFN